MWVAGREIELMGAYGIGLCVLGKLGTKAHHCNNQVLLGESVRLPLHAVADSSARGPGLLGEEKQIRAL